MELYKLKAKHIELPIEYEKQGWKVKQLEHIYNHKLANFELLKAKTLLEIKAKGDKMNAEEKQAKVIEITHKDRLNLILWESRYSKAKQDLYCIGLKYEGIKELGYFYRLESKKIEGV